MVDFTLGSMEDFTTGFMAAFAARSGLGLGAFMDTPITHMLIRSITRRRRSITRRHLPTTVPPTMPQDRSIATIITSCTIAAAPVIEADGFSRRVPRACTYR
jgi:hypothetical protein